MPPKKKGGKKHRHNCKPSTSTTAPVSNSLATISPPKLSKEIILSIFKRLPVKSILRFKCTSKQLLSHLSTSKFIAMHLEETSKNPLNHSFIIHSIDEDYHHQISLLNVNSAESQPVSLVNPFPLLFSQMDLVGSLNGLVCLSCPPLGHMIILWNPATNLYKPISLSKRGVCKPGEEIDMISLGFGYDSEDDDYKIIRIACLKPKNASPEALLRSRAEVYSAKLDSWKRVQMDLPFVVYATRNNVIVKGIPYWTSITYQENSQSNFKEVLVYYDIQNRLFKNVNLPKLTDHDCIRAQFVEWKGNLGIIMLSPSRDGKDFLKILVYDEMGMCWNKISSYGPIELNMERPLQCSKDGVILAETKEGKLMLYDPVTNGIKTLTCIPEALRLSFEAFSYTESLVTFKGMQQVKDQDEDKDVFLMEEMLMMMTMTMIMEFEMLQH